MCWAARGLVPWRLSRNHGGTAGLHDVTVGNGPCMYAMSMIVASWRSPESCADPAGSWLDELSCPATAATEV